MIMIQMTNNYECRAGTSEVENDEAERLW